jgi:plasmanylethanolamine desaturase
MGRRETAWLGAPVHYEATRARLLFSGLSIAAAVLLLGAFGFRIAMRLDLRQWWVPPAFAAGIAAADFVSGLIHWGADTWGRYDLPVIGRRLLVPFRLHHVNPGDFLRRGFIDTNGEVAFLAVLVLPGLLTIPVGSAWGGPAAVFGFALAAMGMMTNQIHQWAHMPMPPRSIGALQDCGLILGRAGHAAHHERPFDSHYCITTGWCNKPLEAIRFFQRLEAAITFLTGARARRDDRRYEEHVLAVAAAEAGHG